jgi:hypothetical protein
LEGLKRSINQKKFQNTLLKRNLGREIKNDKMHCNTYHGGAKDCIENKCYF